jgi:3-deoxy-D-manno-octulosonic-acid transferase
MGPHYENFRGIVDKLLSADAIALVEPSELPNRLQSLLTDSRAARDMGVRARRVFDSEAGATETAVESLLDIACLTTGVRA